MLHVEILEHNAVKIRKLAAEAGTSYNSMTNTIVDIALRNVDPDFFTKHIKEALQKSLIKPASKPHP